MIESFGKRALAERLVVPMDFKRKPWEQKLPLHQSQRHQWESFPVGFSGGGITKGYAAEEIKNADPSTLPILSLNPAKPGDLLPGVYSMSVFQGKRFHQNLWAEEELNLPCIKYSSITDENSKAPFPTVEEISCVLIKGSKKNARAKDNISWSINVK
ncbi:hypothetical protein OIU85_008862 [Salix viminalis]|uniref:Uncharacterized protein n=1 Tax=Salix viminalis TaxID=40686 RepID=A0A9Q0NYM1_SALVM|nr:hypothetical protein OIU85_008862 [Salix viminalis]